LLYDGHLFYKELSVSEEKSTPIGKSVDPVAASAKRVAELAFEHKLTIAIAESATGGLISSALTNVPGSSKIFCGGVVCYRNEVKSGIMQISSQLLKERGAVSKEVTSKLVEKLAELIPSDLGVAVTGVAGPDLDDHKNPVGTLHIAIRSPSGSITRSTTLPQDDRKRLKELFSLEVLSLLRTHIEELTAKNK
jgi:PncC family amidohydrolase